MLATVGRDVALEKLEIEHIAVRSLIAEMTDEEKTRPDTIEYGLYADQELSFKDLLAHLVCYEAYSLEALEAWKRGEKHWIIDAMQSPTEGRKVHYAGIEDRRGLSLAQMVDEWERTQSALMDVIGNLTDAEWKTPAPFATPTPLDLGGMLEIILVAPPRPVYRHLPVHIPDTAAYVRKLRQPSE